MMLAMKTYLIEFFILFFGIGIGAYVLPAGGFYWWFHLKSKNNEDHRIQRNNRFTAKDIEREVWLSIQTIFIFSFFSLGLLQLIKSGDSAIYYDFNEYSWWYAVLSFFLCLIAHDTYFYWTHRFMHWRPVFKYTHLGHHRSRTPSPWAILAFQPGEAVFQFIIFALLILFLPLHPIVFVLYLIYDTMANTAGHNGFELVPKWTSNYPILKFGSTVTHHDLHHIDVSKNFGSFFNFWDRIMNTYSDDLNVKAKKQSVG